jgi:hypothetical protein
MIYAERDREEWDLRAEDVLLFHKDYRRSTPSSVPTWTQRSPARSQKPPRPRRARGFSISGSPSSPQ